MEVVISGENRTDSYGNFYFKDKGGTEHKIGEKRENQQELIDLVKDNPDRAVQFKMESYKGRDYIVGIELLEKLITVDEAKLKEQQVAPTPRTPPPANRNDNIDKRCALIQATNLVGEGKIGVADWLRWATEFNDWLSE